MSQPFKRAGIWQFRRAVPDDLVQAIGKLEIKKSLGTRDPAEAKGRHAQAFAESDRLFARARAQLAGESVLTPEDVKQLASRWYREESLRVDKVGDFLPWLGVESRSIVETAQGEHESIGYTTLRRGWERDGDAWDAGAVTAPIVERVLCANGVPIPKKDSQAWGWLIAEFDEQLHRMSAWALDRHEGGHSLPGAGALPHARLSTEMEQSAGLATATKPAGHTLKELFDAYAASKRSSDKSRSTEVTLGEYGSAIDDFIELHGNVDVGLELRDLVREHHLALAKLPSKGKGMAKLTAPERIARAERDALPRLTTGTIRNRIRKLSAVLSHGVARGWLKENPINAGGLGREVARAATRQQGATRELKHYTPEQLATIFASAAFTDPAWKPARAKYGQAWYWLPILMYYSGARVEELAQLAASEVRRSSEGIPYISVLEGFGGDGDRTVKTQSSRRMIPLHDDVVARGFLQYVGSLPAGGRLFPLLKASPSGYYSTNFAKRWGEYVRDIARVQTTADPSHGFRHTFKTLAREVSIPEDVHDGITGHAGPGVGRTYGEMMLTTMAAALKRFPTIQQIIERADASGVPNVQDSP